MRKIRALLPVALASMLLVAYMTVWGDGPRPMAGALPAASASDPPAFSLAATDGRRVSLADFAGKRPVLLVFWATWCRHCYGAVPRIKELHAGSTATGLAVLAIDVLEEPKTVGSYVRARNIDYAVLMDRDGAVARAYRVAGVPTYIVIDRSGRIRYRGNVLPGDIRKYL